VDELVIRTTPDQLRGLRKVLVVVAAFTIILIPGAVLADGSLGTRLDVLAAAGGISSLALLWVYSAYSRAFTECSPAGIRTRSLGGLTECPWTGVAKIALCPRGQTVTVMVTTTNSTRFRLGTPVDGGAMGDPEFALKVAAIQQYWRTATRTPPEG
jgi:hypothetical protein